MHCDNLRPLIIQRLQRCPDLSRPFVMVLLILFVILFNRELCRNMLTKNDQKGNKRDIRSAFDRIEYDCMIKSLMHSVRFCFFYSVFFFPSLRTPRINPVSQCVEHGFARSEMITTSIGVQAIQNWELWTLNAAANPDPTSQFVLRLWEKRQKDTKSQTVTGQNMFYWLNPQISVVGTDVLLDFFFQAASSASRKGWDCAMSIQRREQINNG